MTSLDKTTVSQNPKLNNPKTLEVMTRVLKANANEAAANRACFDDMNLLTINLMSGPGSGKTTLLETTAQKADFSFGVIEGDLETERDAERLQKLGVRAYQIMTGTSCHLDAKMVQKAIPQLGLDGLQVLFVENVGNLVCPASYDLGTHLNVVLLSTPEGDDKVLKYPVMFRTADLVLVTKAELAPMFDFSIDRVRSEVKQLKPEIETIALSAKTGEGFDAWLDFVKSHLKGAK
ncbi:MAG: hydrogenase nickel incorporation protein HypB [Campylobacterales bacterium]